MFGVKSLHARRALMVPAAVAIVAGAGATTTGALAPQWASAETAACPTLVASPQSYSTAGVEQCFTVPANVTTLHAVLVGGTGGSGDQGGSGTGGTGGFGAQVTADITVVPGEVISVEIGGAGSAGGENAGDHGKGGFNGGGPGGDDGDGGGGGGATDLRTVAATVTACDDGTSFAGHKHT